MSFWSDSVPAAESMNAGIACEDRHTSYFEVTILR